MFFEVIQRVWGQYGLSILAAAFTRDTHFVVEHLEHTIDYQSFVAAFTLAEGTLGNSSGPQLPAIGKKQNKLG